LTADQFSRYRRQMILPELGVAGQRRLLSARVLVVGVGALGSAASTYLAAAGVGTLGLVDGDRVEASNLHRQVAHRPEDVGAAKTASARRHLESLNPDVRVVEHPLFLAPDNARPLVRDYDLVVNGTDTFPARYLVNDACVLERRPLVDAAILRFEGQLTTYVPGAGCYRCIFPQPPPAGSVPDCAEAGVLGALAGVMGSMQAVEALKILAGMGDNPGGRLMLYDALGSEWHTVSWRRNPACPLCGDAPTQRDLLADYEAFCGAAPTAGFDAEPTAASVGVERAARLAEEGALVVDVRTPQEFERGHIPGALSVPLARLGHAAPDLPADRPILCVCAVGARSARAAAELRRLGFEAYSLDGGTLAWTQAAGAWEAPAPASTGRDRDP
jgi:molybdopterin/thiamine biosynthesis adenylyltransferase/rhodanese-related sulfurtransferase